LCLDFALRSGDPEIKRQSATWLRPKKLKTQKLRMQKLLEKQMLTALLDAKGIIHHKFWPQKKDSKR
jgi:hypothetical protein